MSTNQKSRKAILMKSSAKPSYKDSIQPDIGIIDFNTRVKPIFVSRCPPCHFAGQKMDERLPFDKDTTIVVHREGHPAKNKRRAGKGTD